MFFAASLERIDLENPKSAVANRPPSKLSDQDKTNLHTSFAQVDQARCKRHAFCMKCKLPPESSRR